MQHSIKEYIGARYIPVFYDDGTGSANWRSNDTYEPLTIVLYQGNSYTSRQYVPEGIAITNTDYWLQTGNWNSQIEAYRQEVQTFDSRIDANATAIATERTNRIAGDNAISDRVTTHAEAINALSARVTTAESDIDTLQATVNVMTTETAVLIGDSWGTGSTGGGPTVDGWPVVFKTSFPSIVTWRESHTGGAGFVHKAASNNKNFVDMLEDLIEPLSDTQKANVKMVLVAGGLNDISYPTSDIRNAVNDFCRIARIAFPNAKILLAGINLMTPAATRAQCFTIKKCMVENASYGASYIRGSELAALQSTFTADGNHLENYSLVGRVLAQGVITGSCEQICNSSAINFTLASGLTRSAGALSFETQTINDLTQIKIAGFGITPASPISIGSTISTTLDLGYIDYTALPYNIFKNNNTPLNTNLTLYGLLGDGTTTQHAVFELAKQWDNENRRCNLKLRHLYGTVNNVTYIFVAAQSPNVQSTFLM